MRKVSLVLAAMAVSMSLGACAKEGSELAPYPCPASGRCADGLTCVAGECLVPEFGGACSRTTDEAHDSCHVALGSPHACVVLDTTTQTGLCTIRCASDADCDESGLLCSRPGDPSGRGVCIPQPADECPINTQPRADGYCTPVVAGAHARCDTDAACAPPLACVVDTCTTKCDGVTACAQGEVCAGGGCMPSCPTKDASCGTDGVCVLRGADLVCVERDQRGMGVVCQTSVDCGSGLSCRATEDNRYCAQACSAGSCPTGFTCETKSNVCLPENDYSAASCNVGSPSPFVILLGLGALRRRRRRG